MPHAELDGLRVGFDELGSGPALLLLSGLGADGSSSAFAAQRCAAAGYRVVTMDNAGRARASYRPGR